VRWSLNAMIAAEEMGVTSKNVKAVASKENKNKEVNRLLGPGQVSGQMADVALRRRALRARRRRRGRLGGFLRLHLFGTCRFSRTTSGTRGRPVRGHEKAGPFTR